MALVSFFDKRGDSETHIQEMSTSQRNSYYWAKEGAGLPIFAAVFAKRVSSRVLETGELKLKLDCYCV